MIDLLTFLLLLLAWLIILVIIWFTSANISTFRGGPPIPTKRAIVKKMIEMAQIKPGERVVDLGAGDGRLVFAAARAGARAIGYEVSWPVYLASRLTQFIGRRDGKLIRKNIFYVSLENADIVFCYLLPETMQKLKSKFERELLPHARVVSHAFPVPSWPIEKKAGNVFLQYRP